MSRPRWQVPSRGVLEQGSAKRDDIIGFKRDARAPLNQGARAPVIAPR
jgi:hypothetical protein